MATCILNIFLGDCSRQQPIISSTEFSRDEFFNADTRRFFFDSNDTAVDQESVLQKILHKLTFDATSKLQKSHTSLDLRIKDEIFVSVTSTKMATVVIYRFAEESSTLSMNQRRRSSSTLNTSLTKTTSSTITGTSPTTKSWKKRLTTKSPPPTTLTTM